jgi:hypothetical protein
MAADKPLPHECIKIQLNACAWHTYSYMYQQMTSGSTYKLWKTAYTSENLYDILICAWWHFLCDELP